MSFPGSSDGTVIRTFETGAPSAVSAVTTSGYQVIEGSEHSLITSSGAASIGAVAGSGGHVPT